MRIAVLADVHGNLPALRAVLAELDADPVDAIVSAGDIAPGPFAAECLATLRARPEPLHWVSGNGERDIVRLLDGEFEGDELRRATREHGAMTLGDEREAFASWPASLVLDGICVCHGSPGSVDDIITSLTPEPALRALLGDPGADLVVGGHTHQQVVRRLPAGPDYVNAGSIGRPFEGDPAAYWLVVSDGAPRLRRTDYDVDDWVARVRASDWPTVDDLLEGCFSPLYPPGWIAAFFEHVAGRGDDPGDPAEL